MVMLMWWQYALWGLAGAAANRGVVYLQAAERVKGKGPAWRVPYGPGGGLYLLSVMLHCVVGVIVTGAIAESGWIRNAAIAVGIGAAAPVALKRVSAVALAVVSQSGGEGPGELDSQGHNDPGGEG